MRLSVNPPGGGQGRPRRWAGVAFLTVEGAAQIVGHGDCPVGPMQAEWGDPVPFFVQVRWHAPARAYIERHRAGGKSWLEAVRCLKRYLARVIFRTMLADALRSA